MTVFDNDDRDTAERLFEVIRRLSENGPYHPGVTRPSYSAMETATLNQLEDFAFREGLKTSSDAADNLWIDYGERRDQDEDERAIWIGSHVDSVPQGGNYDGLAGVIAGILCLRKLKQRGETALKRKVRVIALRGEESAWFGIPYIGAKALLGKLTLEDLARAPRGGESLREHMKICGADVIKIGTGVPLVDVSRCLGFWELHIEQGPVLVAEGKPVGVVSNIRGNVRYMNVRIVGREGHSGTVPRELRADAVFAFAAFISVINESWAETIRHMHDLVVTCGIVETDSSVHGITRIPGSVRFCLEWRSESKEILDVFHGLVKLAARDVERMGAHSLNRGDGKPSGVSFEFDEPVLTLPAQLDRQLVARSLLACDELGIPKRTMPSGAGHDAAVFANAGVPTGMIFVRNENGSHNPAEAMDMADFMLGVEVLYRSVTQGAAP